jgi:hypothetical protein
MRKIRVRLSWALRIMVAKRTVARVQPDFEIDLEVYSDADFESYIPALEAVEQRLLEAPTNRSGLGWVHFSEEVLFHGRRTFNLPYDDFIAKVDICHVGRFYRDAIGVTTEIVSRDTIGRTRHQGVRVVALPQPNYAAFMGKVELDVYKLETIIYGPDEQKVWMRTVHSPNDSAVCDDGYVSFSRALDGVCTVVTFLSCQNFPIPPLMALFRVDRWAWAKTVITESAYSRFFNSMMDNVLDCYHQRPFEVGRSRRLRR